MIKTKYLILVTVAYPRFWVSGLLSLFASVKRDSKSPLVPNRGFLINIIRGTEKDRRETKSCTVGFDHTHPAPSPLVCFPLYLYSSNICGLGNLSRGSRGGKVGVEGRLQAHHSQGKGRQVSISSRRPQTSGQASANSGPLPCRGFQSPCLECTEAKKSNLVPSTARRSPMRGCSRSSSYASTRSSSHSSRSPNPRVSPRYTRSRSTSSGKRWVQFWPRLFS